MNKSSATFCSGCGSTFSEYTTYAGHDCKKYKEMLKRLKAVGK